MTSTQSSASPSFWRCDRCGTPNPSAPYILSCLGCGSTRPPRGTEADASQTRLHPSTAQIRRRKILLGCVVGYGLIVFLASLMIRVVGDAWWIGLVLLMSPRWLFLIPCVPLGLGSWRMKRPLVGGLVVVEVLFVLGPLMGFGLPWGRFGGRPPEGPTLRVMTFNRGDGPIDVARLTRYLERHNIDVVCFQEVASDPVLDASFEAAKWHRDASRSIASRYPIVAELPRPPDHHLDQLRWSVTVFRVRIKGPGGREFVAGSIHLPTLRPGLHRVFGGDVAGLRLHDDWWNQELNRLVDFVTTSGGLPDLIAGDFNRPVESAGLSNLLEQGRFKSAFEEAGFGWGYTRPASMPWVRIDHILVKDDWTVTRCWIGPDFGSDHRSMVAELAFPPEQPPGP